MAKPTNGIGWIPDNTSNCTDPDAKKTLGFIGSVDRVVANYINWLLTVYHSGITASQVDPSVIITTL